MAQLSYPYMTTGKTIALTRWTFDGKVMSLLFHMLSKLVITILQRSKHLLISCLQSPSAVILEPKKIKFITVSIAPCWCRFDNRWAARHKGIPWVLLLVKGCSPRMSCADGFYKKMESKWSTTQMRKTEAIYSELVEVKRVNHHHLHLADSQSQAVKWERFIV